MKSTVRYPELNWDNAILEMGVKIAVGDIVAGQGVFEVSLSTVYSVKIIQETVVKCRESRFFDVTRFCHNVDEVREHWRLEMHRVSCDDTSPEICDLGKCKQH